MADNHAGLAPASLPDKSTRPHLTKESLASREGRISAAPPNAPTRPDMPSSTSPFSSFGDGSGSSSSKPLFYFRDVTSPSSFSQTQSPDTELEILPKPAQSPRAAHIRHLKPDLGTSAPTSLLSEELSSPLQTPASSPSGASDSEDYGGPTRASIRAWAKATPAGPPKSSSTRNAPKLPQSGSDDSLVHPAPTRTVRDLPVSAESSVQRTSSRSGDNSPGNEESSGDAADAESSESEQNSSPPPTGSPPPDNVKLAAQRELTAPHPHPHPHPRAPSPTYAQPIAHPQPQPAFTGLSADVHQYPTAHPHAHAHAHAHSHAHNYPHAHYYPPSHSRSSPDSSPPAQVVAAAAPASIQASTPIHVDQLEHPERRHHHQRRRHRDRERDRDRDRERRSRHSPSGLKVVSMPALPPLRPLRPPPPPLPMRTLPVFSPRTVPVPSLTTLDGGDNIFKEIENMLRTTRKPLLRVHRDMDPNEDDMGWAPFPTGRTESHGSTPVRRENDVLEDIRTMVHWSLR